MCRWRIAWLWAVIATARSLAVVEVGAKGAAEPAAIAAAPPEQFLVIYAYSQHSAEAFDNVRYFLRFGVVEDPAVFYVFVVNGCHTVDFQAAAEKANVAVVERDNTCFDFGAWGVGFEAAAARGVAFDAVIVLNASVRGPFLPAYEARRWWRVFGDRLANGVGVAGTSLNCMDLGAGDARGAHLQSMLLAFRRDLLETALGPLFAACPETKAGAIYDGELPLSRATLARGLALDTLLLAHGPGGGVIFSTPPDAVAEACDAIADASELGLGDVYFPAPGADAPDVSPLEVVFFKTARSKANRGALERLATWAYFHDGVRGADAIKADFSLLGDPRGEGDCGVAYAPGAAANAPPPPSAEAAHIAALDGALRAANAEMARLRGEVARLSGELGRLRASAVLV